MQAQDGPQALELSDIMHTLSPSPAPQPPLPSETGLPQAHTSHPGDAYPVHSPSLNANHHRARRSASLEPLDQSELDAIRSRLQQLGLNDPQAPHSSATPTERELADMILRLTTRPVVYPLPSQLASQAETIAELTAQRDLLLYEKSELLARFDAERDGWDRSAEALIGRTRASRDGAERDYESDRLMSRLRDDNWSLRNKLADAHALTSTLENELSRLRPLLVMQPILKHDPSVFQHPVFASLGIPELDDKSMRRKRKGRTQREREKERNRVKPERETDPHTLPQPTNANGEADAQAYIDLDVALAVPPSAAAGEGSNMPVAQALQVPTVTFGSHYAFRAPQHPQIPPKETASDPFGPIPSVQPSDLHRHPAPVTQPSASTSHTPDPVKSAPTAPEKPTKKAKEKEKERQSRSRPVDDHTPLLADARSEYLLAVARRMARIRAEMMADMIKERKERERERQREKERQEAERAEAVRKAAANSEGRAGLQAQVQVQGQTLTPGRAGQQDKWQYVWGGVPPTAFVSPYAPGAQPHVAGSPAPGPSRPSGPGSAAGTPRPSHLHPTAQAQVRTQSQAELPGQPQGQIAGPSTPRQNTTPSRLPVAAGTVRLSQSLTPYAIPHPGAGLVYMHPPIPVATPSGPQVVTQPPPHGGTVMLPFAASWPVPSTPTTSRGRGRSRGRGQGKTRTRRGRTPARNAGAGTPTRQGAPTPTRPLDSLVSAARTLMIDEDYDAPEETDHGADAGENGDAGGDGGQDTDTEAASEGTTLEDEASIAEDDESRAGMVTRRRSAAAAALGSPVPKRRRVGAASSAPLIGSGSTTSTPRARTRGQTKADAQQETPQDGEQPQEQSQPADGKTQGKEREVGPSRNSIDTIKRSAPPLAVPVALTRVRSALDVLADQAAQEQERRPSSGPGSQRDSVEPEGDLSTLDKGMSNDAFADDPFMSTPISATLAVPSAHAREAGSRRRPPSAPPSPIPSPVSLELQSESSTSQEMPAIALDSAGESVDADVAAPQGEADSRTVSSSPLSLDQPRLSRAATEESIPRGSAGQHRPSATYLHPSGEPNVSTTSTELPPSRAQETEAIAPHTTDDARGRSDTVTAIEPPCVDVAEDSSSCSPMETTTTGDIEAMLERDTASTK